MTEGDEEGGGAADADGGVAIAGGVGGIFGGITTTDGGRMAATDAGVTSFGAGAGGSMGLGAAGLAVAAGASALTSIDGVVAGGFATGRIAGRSAASLCCVIARNTSPGREICDRSIFVLISSSPWLAERVVLDALDPTSLRERRCFRTSSASCSSRELECVFFSVTPTEVRASRISLLLTSSSRARSLIRIFIRSRFPLRPAQFEYYVRISNLTESLLVVLWFPDPDDPSSVLLLFGIWRFFRRSLIARCFAGGDLSVRGLLAFFRRGCFRRLGVRRCGVHFAR